MRRKSAILCAGLLAALAAAAWWRRHPSACPYALRFSLELPRPVLRRSALREILAPHPGERILEVGPGTGYYSLEVAWAVSPDGTLDVLDLQQEMLDRIGEKARESGIPNIVATRGDARDLPYPDGSFDAVFMVAVLGEVPDRGAVLREARRVLRPGGRLVIGEALPDPHMVSFGELKGLAEAAGLRFERRVGGGAAYFARFAA